MPTKAFLTIHAGAQPLGTLDLILFEEEVPKTVSNFCHFLKKRSAGQGYKYSTFHRIIRGFMAQGGDFLKGDGTGSTSMYGDNFPDENFRHRHDQPGMLSMANSGKDTNGSQFFLTFRATPHLDGRHVVFGKVDLKSAESRKVLQALENVRTGANDRPANPISIADCGVVEEDPSEEAVKSDENEIDLEEEEEGVDKAGASETNPAEDDNELELPEEEEEEPPKTKAEALRQRMRKLKMKMNQARQLNKQEVLREGERLGSVEGAAKARKRQMMKDKKSKEAEWKARNSKALEVAVEHGLDGKHLVEQADASLKKAYKKETKAKINEFEMKDYFNPEGQHRNYEKNIKSLSSAAGPLTVTDATSDTFNPIMKNDADEARERQGARNLANELKRRIEKQKNKRNRLEFDQTDVTSINKRNKRFNEKLSRTYDKHTADIRQNLERGTAL